MFARITHYKMKPEMVADAKAKVAELQSKIMGMEGLMQFINVVDETTGEGYVVSIAASQEQAEANAETAKAIWGMFADHLVEMPTPMGYDVVANWSN